MTKTGWQLIETAPKVWRVIPCWREGWERWIPLTWKTNPRIVAAHAAGQFSECAESYFGDPDESYDYDLAILGNGPTHWFDLPEPTIKDMK